MKCSRCATELPDSATTCPRCGWSTRVVDQPATFSYLPAGTPPWPTALPQRLPYVVDSVPYTAGTPLPPGKAQEKGRAGRTIVTAAILLASIIVGTLLTLGVLYENGQLNQSRLTNVTLHPVTATSTPQTTTSNGTVPTPTSFKSVSDTNLNVSLQYPSTWTAGPLNQTSDPMDYPLTSPTQNGYSDIRVDIEHFSTSTSSTISSAKSLDSAYLQSISQLSGVQNFQTVTPSNAQPTIGGVTWDRQDATLDNANGVALHFTTISVQYKSAYYTIQLLVEANVFQDAMTKDIQPIFNSVHFLS